MLCSICVIVSKQATILDVVLMAMLNLKVDECCRWRMALLITFSIVF